MKIRTWNHLIFISLSCLFWLSTITSSPAIAAELDSLPSWQDEGVKTTIIDFVADVTNRESVNFVEVKDRIAVFDNDGTLWGEYPKYFQLSFLDSYGLGIGETTDSYISAARDFVTTQNNTSFQTPYVNLIYKPMVELLDYLRANDFQVYICSGGEIDFIRAFAEEYYGIPPQNIIGSALTTTFYAESNPPVLLRASDLVEPINDEAGKPVGIERYIGKRPIMAVGNSNGDLEMLEYADDSQGHDLMMLLRHDDLTREHYQEEDMGVDCSLNDDTDPENDVYDGPGSYCHVNKALEKVSADDNWSLISVKDDFTKVFLGTNLD